jgi:hypothetical protein
LHITGTGGICDIPSADKNIIGTSVGDRIEANAAGEIFARDTDSVPVGSVKGNLG